MEYLFLNKDEKLLSFNIISDPLGEIIEEKKIFSENRPLGFKNMFSWLQERNYAKHKEHFKKWLKEWGIDTLEGFVQVTHCLGLNDCYWVKPYDSSLRWDDVNLYYNDFTDVAQKTAFEGGLKGLQLSSTSPEFVSDGSFPKFWKKETDDIYLYKAGTSGFSNAGLEPYSEYIAASISNSIFGDDFLNYNLVMHKGKICTKCKIFTDENIGFVPFRKLLDTSKSYNLRNILDICTEMGFENQFREMIFMDSLVYNQDRHLGNFGVLVNNINNDIIGFSPIFDFNISLLCYAVNADFTNIEKYISDCNLGHKIGGSFTDVGREILLPKQKAKLPKEINLPVHESYNMEKSRLDLIEKFINNNLMLMNPIKKINKCRI